jgi:hypothetical protein
VFSLRYGLNFKRIFRSALGFEGLSVELRNTGWEFMKQLAECYEV